MSEMNESKSSPVPGSRAEPRASTRTSLNVAASDVGQVPELPPLASSFPNSQKVEEGDLAVPFRVIELSGGEPPLKVYDTTGPQGVSVRDGLPKRRAEWIKKRLAEAGPAETRNV